MKYHLRSRNSVNCVPLYNHLSVRVASRLSFFQLLMNAYFILGCIVELIPLLFYPHISALVLQYFHLQITLPLQ
jgi:hypothetical protein